MLIVYLIPVRVHLDKPWLSACLDLEWTEKPSCWPCLWEIFLNRLSELDPPLNMGDPFPIFRTETGERKEIWLCACVHSLCRQCSLLTQLHSFPGIIYHQLLLTLDRLHISSPSLMLQTFTARQPWLRHPASQTKQLPNSPPTQSEITIVPFPRHIIQASLKNPPLIHIHPVGSVPLKNLMPQKYTPSQTSLRMN